MLLPLYRFTTCSSLEVQINPSTVLYKKYGGTFGSCECIFPDS